jgi:RNA-directed DNA polymerase
MTTLNSMLGAPLTEYRNWKLIKWDTVKYHVRRLQLRIAKAIKQKRFNKAKALQWLLTHSFFAKLLAIKRVTENKGKRTPGVDKITWKTPLQKLKAVKLLKRRGYKSLPLRRIHIPKKNGKLRPLGIPTFVDRAQQALHLLALEPVAEIQADLNSYGFRPKRSLHDAIGQCFLNLCRKNSPQWILEGDIKACFDKISHKWLEEHIMMDTPILKQWLKAGFIEKNAFYSTEEGTPQGGIASPSLANIALDGMENVVKAVGKARDKINFVRYADDFICTAANREILEQKVLPAIINFLKVRGLELSMEKTKITNIKEGFDFLGFNLRKYAGKLLIKPTKKGVKSFLDRIRETINTMRGNKTEDLIRILNSKIKGWSNHYKHVVSKKAFTYVDHQIFSSLWRWAKRRHPQKSITWIRKKYYKTIGLRRWCFSAPDSKRNYQENLILAHASDTKIIRHVKIIASATPYDQRYHEYFIKRIALKRIRK